MFCEKAKRIGVEQNESSSKMECANCDDSKGASVRNKRSVGDGARDGVRGGGGSEKRARNAGGIDQGGVAQMPGAGDCDQRASRM